MNFEEIDSKVVACVIRKWQDVVIEKSTMVILEETNNKDIPEELVFKTINLVKDEQDLCKEELDKIIAEFEDGSVSFDDFVVASMRQSADLGAKVSNKVFELMTDYLTEHPELV